jgi:hypothetical protein
MTTRVPAVLSALVSIAEAAVPSDCTVLDSWLGATEYGKILRIGVPDLGLLEVGALTQPSVVVEQSGPLGGSTTQAQVARVFCSLEVPSGETAAQVRDEAGVVLNALDVAVSARGAIDGTQGAYLTENAWYQGDQAAGFGAVVTFTINVDLYG